MTSPEHNTARLQILDYWGETSHDHLSFNALADDVWRNLQRSGKASALKRYTIEGSDSSETSSRDRSKPLPPAGIGLSYRNVFPQEWNSKTNWSGANTDNLFEFDNPFRSGRGLMHGSADVGQLIEYSSSHSIGRNQGHTLRISLAKQAASEDEENDGANADEARKHTVIREEWDKWRFEIRDGQARIALKAKGYSTSQDAQLDALLNKEERTLGEEQQIVQLRELLFEIDQDVSLQNGNLESGFGAPTTLTFLPEARGILRIECEEDGRSTVIPIPSIQKTREPGVLWEASSLRLSTTGGVFLAQFGKPAFNTWFQMRMGEYTAQPPTGLAITKNADTTYPGCDITVENVKVRDGEGGTGQYEGANTYEVVVTFTGNGEYSPLLYGCQVFAPAGERDGTDEVVYDTNDHLDDFEHPPILEIEPQLEADHKRSSVRVTLTVSDLAEMPEFDVAAGELPRLSNRLCNLFINGEMWLKGGVITGAQWSDLADDGTLKPESQLIIDIADIWAILDEDRMWDDPIGDDEILGDYIDTVLRGSGMKASERGYIKSLLGMGGVGRRLPKAAPGEEPCVRPEPGTPRGQFLRELIDKYGFGRTLYWRREVGQMAVRVPSTNVKAAFVTTGETLLNWIEQPVDVSDDYADCFNAFAVQGVKDALDRVIEEAGFIYESFRNPKSPLYLGFVRWYQVVKDEGLRTRDDVLYVWRSLRKRYCRPCRFVQFRAWFNKDLAPGDIITIDGKRHEIERIPSGSWSGFGDMTIVARVLA